MRIEKFNLRLYPILRALVKDFKDLAVETCFFGRLCQFTIKGKTIKEGERPSSNVAECITRLHLHLRLSITYSCIASSSGESWIGPANSSIFRTLCCQKIALPWDIIALGTVKWNHFLKFSSTSFKFLAFFPLNIVEKLHQFFESLTQPIEIDSTKKNDQDIKNFGNYWFLLTFFFTNYRLIITKILLTSDKYLAIFFPKCRWAASSIFQKFKLNNCQWFYKNKNPRYRTFLELFIFIYILTNYWSIITKFITSIAQLTLLEKFHWFTRDAFSQNK